MKHAQRETPCLGSVSEPVRCINFAQVWRWRQIDVTSILIYTEKEVKPKEDIRTSATLVGGVRWATERALVFYFLVSLIYLINDSVNDSIQDNKQS